MKWASENLILPKRRASESLPPDTDAVLDQLAEVTSAIKDSADLQQWFRALSRMTEGQRSNCILRTTIDMTTNGGSHRLINAFWLLSNAKIYAAVKQALLEDGVEV